MQRAAPTEPMDNFMQSMKVSELLAALDEFRSKLIAHRELWGKSLDDIVPGFPVSSQQELEEQSQWLTRRLGALRPYIERFDSNWIMQHPATGSMWDALDAASGLSSVSPIKAPSLRNAIEKLNSIAGRLEGLDQNDAVPVDRNVPIRSGVGPDRLMLAYMAHLHPYIAKGCSGLFADEHYPQAIEESAKAVFEYLREVATSPTKQRRTSRSDLWKCSRPTRRVLEIPSRTHMANKKSNKKRSSISAWRHSFVGALMMRRRR